ncbi:hypothetical protein BH23PAT2_BH23PAT2_06270 [soil metagenome]
MPTKSLFRKSRLIGLGFAFALIGFTAVFLLTQSTLRSVPVNASACQEQVSVCISLLPDGPSEDIVYITSGQNVQFNSADGRDHNLYLRASEHNGHADHAHDGVSEKESGVFGADEGWLASFDHTGTYVFEDSNDHDLTVTVIVYDEQPFELK